MSDRKQPNTPREQVVVHMSTTPRPALARLPFSKPRSRFVHNLNHPLSTLPPSSGSDSESESDPADQYLDDAWTQLSHRRRRRRVTCRSAVEWSSLLLLTSLLTSALTVHSLRHLSFLGLSLWRWALMALVMLSGRLFSGWLVSVAVLIVERRFLLREKVIYFVYGIRKSFQNCVWLALVLLVWTILIDARMELTRRSKSALAYVSRALVAFLVAAVIWLIKIVLVKVLASSFYVTTFFNRMKESVFHHYILETLSGPSHLVDEDINDSDHDGNGKMERKQLGVSKTLPARLESRHIDMEKLRRLSRARATACNVRRLVVEVMSRGLSTLSTAVDRTMEEEFRRAAAGSEEITTELMARAAAERVFRHVAKPGHRYIEEDDLRRFLTDEEVQTIFPLFEGAHETGKIKRSAFRNWVVRAYMERKSLGLSLNDTKTAVQQLHKIASAVVSVIIIVISLLVMGVATTKVLFVVTSQLLLVGFMFQNTGKTIFESIIFVFVMHPFDVGDRCVIDGVQMIVEEMNILTTVFLRYDNEKIYYPNAVLLTKPISNFYRSPDMGDTIEFAIDVRTSTETFAAMKRCIETYLENKPKHWQPKHSVVVKEIENVNKMKVALNVLHTMNYQNYPERNNRRSELLFELKRIFESLDIKYHLLPQEVHLTQPVVANGRIPMPVLSRDA